MPPLTSPLTLIPPPSPPRRVGFQRYRHSPGGRRSSSASYSSSLSTPTCSAGASTMARRVSHARRTSRSGRPRSRWVPPGPHRGSWPAREVRGGHRRRPQQRRIQADPPAPSSIPGRLRGTHLPPQTQLRGRRSRLKGIQGARIWKNWAVLDYDPDNVARLPPRPKLRLTADLAPTQLLAQDQRGNIPTPARPPFPRHPAYSAPPLSGGK